MDRDLVRSLNDQATAAAGSKETWQGYLEHRKSIYEPYVHENMENNLVSEANWLLRAQCLSAEELGMFLHVGDVCFMDFGQAYIQEIGYQHFGIIMSICRKKALVIPMTSNPVQYAKAYDAKENPHGKIHLMRLGEIPGLRYPSVLFLNDMKFVNTARVIEVKAHVDVDSVLFRRIQQRMMQVMFLRDDIAW